MPLFSTIIPTYNRADLLRQTLESVLSSDGPQVIVVDDGSTDGTLDMLASYGSRIQVLRQSNRGPGTARNLGLGHATGEYVAFLDSDDVWFPWTPGTYQQVIETHGRPAFIAGKPHVFSTSAELATATRGEKTEVSVFGDYYASGDKWRWYGVSSFVVRRDALLKAGGFTNDAVNGEDADLAMKLGVESGFVQMISPVTFGYRKHGGNITDNLIKNYHGLSLLIGQEENCRYPGGGNRRAERLRIISRHVRTGSVALLRAGFRAEAWELYRRTLKWNVSEMRLRYLAAMPLMMLSRAKRPASKGAG